MALRKPYQRLKVSDMSGLNFLVLGPSSGMHLKYRSRAWAYNFFKLGRAFGHVIRPLARGRALNTEVGPRYFEARRPAGFL